MPTTLLVSVLLCENKMWRLLISCLCLWHVANAQEHRYTSDIVTCDKSSNNVQYPNLADVKGSEPRVKALLNNGADVLCDTETDGGGWTIIQKRYDGSLDFHLDWYDYEYGFGSLDKEFWVGLKLMHEWNYKRCYELRVDMRYNGKSYYASYSYFKLHGSNDNYRMKIGTYTGTAGDSLTHHNGMPFTTKDKDNDSHPRVNCAGLYHGAWWHRDCHQSNLNGLFGSQEYGKGLNWISITEYFDTVSDVEMKIRPCY